MRFLVLLLTEGTLAMSDTTASESRFGRFFVTQPDKYDLDNKYTEAALERHKREGLELAVRARWVAMGLTGILLIYLNPNWDVLWYHFILLFVIMKQQLRN